MSYSLIPTADYKAACAAIRAKTGTTDLIKSGDMATEISSAALAAMSQAYVASEGLTFQDFAKISYVTGIGLCKDSIVVIPAVHNGLLVTKIDTGAFKGCNFTDVIIPKGITDLGAWGFKESALQRVTIHGGVSKIPTITFAECRSLTEVSIQKGVSAIDDHAFQQCYALTHIELPDTINSIGEGIFSSCTKLASIVLPNYISTIPKDALFNCRRLASIYIPQSVTNIGQDAFADTILTDVYYPGTAEQWAAITIEANNDPLTSATIHYNWVGTLENPLTASQTKAQVADLEDEAWTDVPYYTKGVVTSLVIPEEGNYYYNAYISDGVNEFSIFSMNPSDGIGEVKVGDTITVCGYIAHRYGRIEFASKYIDGTSVYTYIVAHEPA